MWSSGRRVRHAVWVVAAVAAVAGCGGGDDIPAADAAAPQPSGQVPVTPEVPGAAPALSGPLDCARLTPLIAGILGVDPQVSQPYGVCTYLSAVPDVEIRSVEISVFDESAPMPARRDGIATTCTSNTSPDLNCAVTDATEVEPDAFYRDVNGALPPLGQTVEGQLHWSHGGIVIRFAGPGPYPTPAEVRAAAVMLYQEL